MQNEHNHLLIKVSKNGFSNFLLSRKCTIECLLLSRPETVDMLNVSMSVYRYQN